MIIKDFDIAIKEVYNGYVLARIEENDDGYDAYQYFVYSVNDDESVEHVIKMLYDLLDFLGVNFNSRSAHMVNIIDSTGTKYDPTVERTAEVLRDLQWSIPVDDIDFRCTKHPNYDGLSEPDKDCFQCKAIHQYVLKNNI